MSDPLLFEDTFTITAINSQKYDRVSRLTCTSSDSFTTFTLDVNTELYPCAVGESLSMALASTLSLDGKEDSKASWREVGMGEQTLANDYDYVCHGKAYRFEEGVPRAICKASFITIEYVVLANWVQGRFYLLWWTPTLS